MTTIAWDGKSLAADRKSSSQGALWRSGCKIRKVRGGYVACAGDVGQINKFLRWYQSGCKDDEPELDDFGAISVIRGELIVWDGASQVPCEYSDKLAIGSGWEWAAAAMDHGKTAAEAIEYAATRDNSTGCGVDSVQPTVRKARK